MEIIGLLTFVALIALTAYTVHVAGGGEDTPFIGPRLPRHRHAGHFRHMPFGRH
jgi:hypothetical protein